MRYLLLALLLAIGPTLAGQHAFLEDFGLSWKGGSAYILELAEQLPAEDYDFRPTPEQMSAGEQLLHMARNMAWLSADYLGGKPIAAARFEEATTKAEIVSLLHTTLLAAQQAITELDPATLDEEVPFFAGPMSRRRILFLLHDHLTHHRGQLVVYLRLQGLTPPSYRGW